MPAPLVECIPNFSEARRPEVIEAILEQIHSVPGGIVLDRHSDLDHNRTVLTFIGSPEYVEEAAFKAIVKAAELIDLNKHTGEHPRIGATDVVPFVPIRDIKMPECIEIAKRLGKRVGDELGIPVYLYEDAATRPERHNLENIRHGEYEALKEEIGVKPEREPDYGPSKVGPAGATVIGAREALIAYNVYLNTNNIDIANKIARAIRFSSGGLRFVKSLGMFVGGQAQVSMNLTNFHRTPMFRVVEMIRREAARYGVSITHSELVGMVPLEALTDSAVWYLQLDNYKSEEILENRVNEAITSHPEIFTQQKKEPDFLEQLASGTPTPGGGSASAHTGAVAAALVAMVARLTTGKKKYQAVEEHMQEIIAKADKLRIELNKAVEDDAQAFDQLLTAIRMPKETEEEKQKRAEAMQAATYHAAEVPLSVAKKSLQVLELATVVASEGNVNAISDAGSAAANAQASMDAALLNVQINLLDLKEQEKAQELLKEAAKIKASAKNLQTEMSKTLQERGGLELS
jgi:glutamate formiminotransferase/formiminotetrahydrofolate cyclodeaminase